MDKPKRKRDTCGTVRHVKVHHETVNMLTGSCSVGWDEWVARECGVPLFSSDGDVCKSCRNGWQHPESHTPDQCPGCPALTAEVGR